MKKLIVVVLLILNPLVAKSDPWVELQDVDIQYKKFEGDTRSPYLWLPGLEDHSLQSELNLNIDLDLLDHLYWNNTVHSLNDGAYRLIGWNWRFGIHLTDYIDFGWNHFSEHYTDYISPFGFPLQNSIEINIHLFRKKNTGKGLF